MKQGSTDDPFADDPDAERADTADEPTDVAEGGAADQSSSSDLGNDGRTGSSLDPEPSSQQSGQQSADRQSEDQHRHSLPYIHARDGVKDGRTQRPVFLRDDVEAGIDELVATVEAEFGEDVYKTDVTEAAMVVAQEHPELVVAELEAWGYGWD
ncbi:hypothetical protein [Halomicrobium mukohataei]|uniref:Uncharacterized protein n=2 Tax=Halomicrobium mukohataei TaxID=57705 RepID=C7P503_HALMD|nr:hypothetical protein [Halomicrobium mukohataei]ACV49398.1 conserved hypothetical protein [Halomicrobium mukohataei DSM 12286]QCD67225.1 hypothetical protein E5139_16390 [Halomicrobium mukohataei]